MPKLVFIPVIIIFVVLFLFAYIFICAVHALKTPEEIEAEDREQAEYVANLYKEKKNHSRRNR